MSTWGFTVKKSLAWTLVASLMLSLAVVVKPVEAATNGEKLVTAALKKAVNYYYKRDRSYKFDGFDWELVGLAAAGEKLNGRKWLDKKGNSAFDQIVPVATKADNAGELAKYAIALMKNGYDPTAVNGVDLLKEIVNRQEKSGKMGDDTYTISNHVYAIVALEMYGYEYNREAAVDFLLEHYDDFETDPNRSKYDELGVTLNALAFLEDEDGVEKVEQDVIKQILDGQNPTDGSYSYNTYGPSPDTTSQVLIGLTSAGQDVLEGSMAKTVEYLIKKQVKNGGFESSWSPGEASPYTTKFALVALASAKTGDNVYELTDEEKDALKPYSKTVDLNGQIEVYEGIDNLLKGKQTKPVGQSFSVSASQVMVRTNVSDLVKEGKPLAVFVQVSQDKKVVQSVVVESNSSAAQQLTAGFSLAKGTYTVQMNYWYGLTEKKETAKEPITFTIVVK
ncbi:MAG: prenyltransferase/squalene oxidase repeat-containing protein [Clostridia bacterium]